MEWEEQLMQTCKWKELRKQLVLPIKKKEREEQLVEEGPEELEGLVELVVREGKGEDGGEEECGATKCC